MERFFDNLLESTFGGFNSQMLFANIIMGALLIVVGLFLLKKQSSKGKKTVGWICIGMGCIGILSGAVQLLI